MSLVILVSTVSYFTFHCEATMPFKRCEEELEFILRSHCPLAIHLHFSWTSQALTFRKRGLFFSHHTFSFKSSSSRTIIVCSHASATAEEPVRIPLVLDAEKSLVIGAKERVTPVPFELVVFVVVCSSAKDFSGIVSYDNPVVFLLSSDPFPWAKDTTETKAISDISGINGSAKNSRHV